MGLGLSGHSVAYRTEYHLAWILKYRNSILNFGFRGRVSEKAFSQDDDKSISL